MSGILAKEAYEILQLNDNYIMVDVRTKEEWAAIGTPSVKNIVRLSTHFRPDMSVNPDFIAQLDEKIQDKSKYLLFMCRTNGRSSYAAAQAVANGYANSLVVMDGFEGTEFGPGWKNSNLPFETYEK